MIDLDMSNGEFGFVIIPKFLFYKFKDGESIVLNNK